MAWDKNLPQDSTKIRNYPTLLTNNFKAVEEGDQGLEHWQVRFNDRDALGIASNPTRADDEMAIFSKDDGTNTEMYIMDDQNPANFIQITQAGDLGSTSTDIVCNDITIGSSNTSFSANQAIVAHATVNSAGTLVNGFNITGATRQDKGRYQITVAADVLINVNYRVIAQAFDLTSDSGRRASVHNKPTPVPATTVKIDINITGQSTTTYHDEQFDVIIVGGQL